jgi:outer membrane protein W
VRKTLIALLVILGCAVVSPAAVRASLMAGFASAIARNDGAGWEASASGEIDLNSFLAVGFRAARTSLPLGQSDSGLGNGRLTLIPVEVFLQFRWPGKGRFKPYLCVGGGYSFNSQSLASAVTNGWASVGLTAEEKVENSLVALAGGGLDFAITPRLLIFAHAQVYFVPVNGTWSLRDSATEETISGSLAEENLNAVVAGAGLKFRF